MSEYYYTHRIMPQYRNEPDPEELGVWCIARQYEDHVEYIIEPGYGPLGLDEAKEQSERMNREAGLG